MSEKLSTSRRPTKSGQGPPIALLGCAGVFGLIAVVVLVCYFAFRDPTKPVVQPVQADPPKVVPPLTPEQVVKKVAPSTVMIEVTMKNGKCASGSGFFTRKPGFVVTNAHVVLDGGEEAKNVKVIVDGDGKNQQFEAKIYGFDEKEDLALLKIIDGNRLPPPLPLGESKKLTLGQEVTAFGFPFGEKLGKNVSVNRPTVSSLRNNQNGQLDRVQLGGSGLNPGNSGGPVANAKGEVIGVIVSKLSKGDGIAFAIPSETTKQFLDDQFAEPVGKRILKTRSEIEGSYWVRKIKSKGIDINNIGPPPNNNDEWRAEIQHGQFVTFPGGKEVVWGITVDDDPKPAHLNLVRTKNGHEERSYGIYELEDGVLTICRTVEGKEKTEKDRPQALKASDDVIFMILEKH